MSAPSKVFKCQVRDVAFGANVTVVEPVNLYECTIGDGCFIGPFVEIQRGVRSATGHGCSPTPSSASSLRSGRTVSSVTGMMFINDLFAEGGPARGRMDLWKPTHIGNHVSIGSNATVLPVKICDRAVIGAGSVVTRDITRPGIYAGNPARLLRGLWNGIPDVR